MGKYINPFTDYGFKKIFGQELSKDLLIDFLNDLLEGERVITDLTFLNNEQLPEWEDARALIYDIYCTTDTGEKIIVEMQNKSQVHFRERALFYLSHAVARQGQVGCFWNFDIKAVYGVFFMNFLLKDSVKFRTDVILADRETGELFTDKMRQIFLALPVFKKEEEECETNFERWIYTLKNMETLQRMPFKARKAVFEKLEEIASVSSLNEEEHELYWKSLNAYRTALSVHEASIEEGKEIGFKIGIEQGIEKGIEQGIEKGREIGIEIGIEEGKRQQTLSIARTLKQNNIPSSIIAQSTGLSPEEIEAL